MHTPLVFFDPANNPHIWIFYRSAYKSFNPVFFHPIIRIAEHNILTCRCVYSNIPCGRNAAIFFMYNMNATVLLGILITDCRTVVLAAIVHQNQLKISKCLIQNTVHATVEIGFRLVYRNNNTDLRIHNTHFLMSIFLLFLILSKLSLITCFSLGFIEKFQINITYKPV